MKRRTFTNEYKHQVAKEEIEVGNTSLVARKHDISPTVVGRWVKGYRNNPVAELQQQALSSHPMISQEPQELKQALHQNDQLKKILGEKELELQVLRDLLKKTNSQLPIK